MAKISQRLKMALAMSVLTLTSLGVSPGTAVAQKPQEDRSKACNDLADRKGLTGQDRRTFLKDCNNAKSLDEMNQRDKMDSCKKLADRKNLQGADRRSFIKDCMNKANAK